MYHIQTFQFFALLIALPMFYCFFPIYNNKMTSELNSIKPLFNNYNINITIGNTSKNVGSVKSKTCFLFDETDDLVYVTLSDGINSVRYNKTIKFKHINVAITDQLASVNHISKEIREHFYYSPSYNVLSPGVIISGEDLLSDYRIDETTDEDLVENEQSIDNSNQRIYQRKHTSGKEVCVHNLTFIHFFAIAATELGNKFYNSPGIPSVLYDTDHLFKMYMSICFALICSNMFTRWVVPSKEHLVLYIHFVLIFVSFYHINDQFTQPEPDLKLFAPINYIAPILFFSQLLMRYDNTQHLLKSSKETLWYLWDNYYLMTIPLIIVLIGTYFSSFCWFGVLMIASLIVKFTPKKVSIITKFSALICMAYILLFVNWDFFNFICVVPFFLLLI